MAFELYDTATLAGVIRTMKPPTTYWLDNFFPSQITFDTQEVLLDVYVEVRRLAPFVSPNAQGRVMLETGYSTKSFKPAYVKPKHVVSPDRAIPRLAGEPLLGRLSLKDRFDAIVAENMRLEKVQIMRRWDWLACAAITNSYVVIQGDDYPPVTVNFGRDPSLDVVLTGGAQWNQEGSTPLTDLENARRQSFNLARGAITRLTFGLNAWAAFSSNASVKESLNRFYAGSNSDFNRVIAAADAPYEYRGQLAGSNDTTPLELWTYNDAYEDDTGATQPYMDPNVVVGTGPGLQGTRLFGAIMDARLGLVTTDMVPKMWMDEDPSVVYTMTQSAPLMVPGQPNASFVIRPI